MSTDLQQPGGSHWIPLSDLMTALMMVFMLLAVVYMMRVEQTTTIVVREYEITKKDLMRALQDEFAKDLEQWNAKFLGNMTLRFNDPGIMFATGSDQLSPKFKDVIRDFFPRYLRIINSEKFKGAIKEVRIEGHTSTFWGAAGPQEAYLQNMALSQERTRSVLGFILQLPDAKENESWLKERLTANGLSSSNPVRRSDGRVDEAASQRVEFRIVTNAEERLSEMAERVMQK